MYNEEYRPRRFKDIHGQNKPLKEVIAWLNTWPGQKRALLIHGGAGIGKTVALYVIKEEMNLDLIELNTTDVRDAETISRVVGNAAQSQALFSSRKLILIDEADNIKGRSDAGGTRALAKVIDETENPIILVVNDPYKLPDSIRRRADSIKFNPLRAASIKNRLADIAADAGIETEGPVLQSIAERAGGDMRAAINDLESMGSCVSMEMAESLSGRDSEESIFSGLSAVFKMRSMKSREVFFDVGKPPDEILFWIDENMPKIYDPSDIPCAYNMISRADIFLGRVSRRQHYRLWAYAMDLMTGGVSVCRKQNPRFAKYSSPTYFRMLGRTKARRNTIKLMLSKISEKTHCSRYGAREYIPMLSQAASTSRGALAVKRYFELEPEELEALAPGASKAAETLERQEEKKRRTHRNEEKKTDDTSPARKRPSPKKKGKTSEQTSLFQF